MVTIAATPSQTSLAAQAEHSGSAAASEPAGRSASATGTATPAQPTGPNTLPPGQTLASMRQLEQTHPAFRQAAGDEILNISTRPLRTVTLPAANPATGVFPPPAGDPRFLQVPARQTPTPPAPPPQGGPSTPPTVPGKPPQEAPVVLPPAGQATPDQINQLIDQSLEANLKNFKFILTDLKSSVVGDLMLSTWRNAGYDQTVQEPDNSGDPSAPTRSTPNPAQCDIDGTCPGGSQFDDWLDSRVDKVKSYIQLVAPRDFAKLPEVTSDILKQRPLEVGELSRYMDKYYPAWSPNTNDVALDWKMGSSSLSSGTSGPELQECWEQRDYYDNLITRYCQPSREKITCVTRYNEDGSVMYGPTCSRN